MSSVFRPKLADKTNVSVPGKYAGVFFTHRSKQTFKRSLNSPQPLTSCESESSLNVMKNTMKYTENNELKPYFRQYIHQNSHTPENIRLLHNGVSKAFI